MCSLGLLARESLAAGFGFASPDDGCGPADTPASRKASDELPMGRGDRPILRAIEASSADTDLARRATVTRSKAADLALRRPILPSSVPVSLNRMYCRYTAGRPAAHI